jgi:Carbohydrate esterase, sialic acid-specific acetylesterase
MPRRLVILPLCLLLSLAAACTREKPPRPELLVFIMAGQSNMSGRGELSQLPPGFPANRDRIVSFNNAYEWVEAKEPLDDPKGQKDLCSLDLVPGVGPGVSFGQRLSELMPSVRVGLIPCALSGSRLAQWAPSPRADTLYGSSLKRAAQAGQKGLVRGVLFFQGESDAYSRQVAEQWPRRFSELVAAWRRDLKDSDLPVVFCQLGALGDNLRSDPRFRYWDLLKKEQAAIRIPYVVMVRTDDLALKPDGLHLSTASQIFLGRRLAEAMHRLLIHQPPLPAS